MALYRVSRSLLSSTTVRASLQASTRAYSAEASEPFVMPKLPLDDATVDKLYSLETSDAEIDSIIDSVNYQDVDMFSFEEGRKAIIDILKADKHPAAQRTYKRLLEVKSPSDMDQALYDFIEKEGTESDPHHHHGPQEPGASIFWPTGVRSKKAVALFVGGLLIVPAVVTCVFPLKI